MTNLVLCLIKVYVMLFYINYIFIVLCTYTVQSNDCLNSYVIPEYYQSQFEEMRKKLHILITKIIKSLKDNTISLKSLKYFLSLRPEFRDAARAAKSIEGAMIVVSDHTSLINTKHLQAVAENFELQVAIKLIKKFDGSVEAFCKRIPTQHSYGQDFMKHSCKNLLKPEEVEFVLEWEGDKTTLSDIQSLLRKAFHYEAKNVIVKVVNEGNSIIVICYAPPHLHEELIRLIKDSEDVLRNEKVLSVTIGGFVIIKRKTEDKVRVFCARVVNNCMI